jgi:hypothetical protein
MKQKSLNIFNPNSSFSGQTTYRQFEEGLRRPTSTAPREIKSHNMSLLSLNKAEPKAYKPKDNNIFNPGDSSRGNIRGKSQQTYPEPNSKRVVDSSLIDDRSTYEKKGQPSGKNNTNTSFGYLFSKSENIINRKSTNPKCYRSNLFDEPTHHEIPKRLLK